MLVEARDTGQTAPDATNSRATMNTDSLYSPSAVALDELDVGGSEFSVDCSSVGSDPSRSIPESPSLTVTPAPEGTLAHESGPLNIPHSLMERCASPELPVLERHAMHFWESITFKVCPLLNH
jgi:hypothetical protein